MKITRLKNGFRIEYARGERSRSIFDENIAIADHVLREADGYLRTLTVERSSGTPNSVRAKAAKLLANERLAEAGKYQAEARSARQHHREVRQG